MRTLFITVAIAAALAGCGKSEPASQTGTDASFEARLQEQLLDAKPGSVIEIPAGHYSLRRGLSLRTDGVTIKGAGMDKTVLSFKGQVVGPEGLLVNASDFTIENLALEDTKGDALKINQGKNITIRGVRIEWTDGPKTTNGAYGLYPVKTQNVLIENSVVIGASDAGIYVGQSHDIIVRNNRAEYNVAGVEIENSVNADVYENEVYDNTAGILALVLPNLRIKKNQYVLLRDNDIHDNNRQGFAETGTVVSYVPKGIGILSLCGRDIEIRDNTITNNNAIAVMVVSYKTFETLTGRTLEDTALDAFLHNVYVHGNTFTNNGTAPTLPLTAFGTSFADVVWDGVLEDGETVDDAKICIGTDGDTTFQNIDIAGTNPSTDTTGHLCALTELPEMNDFSGIE